MVEMFRVAKSRKGYVGFSSSENGLRRIFLPEPTAAAARSAILSRVPDAVERANLLPTLADELSRYFAGEPVHFTARLDWQGYNNFEIDVWRACARIAYGTTASYKSLAEAIGCPGAARAVGTAMSRNPCPIVIPCHRILKSDGSIGGYSGPGGIEQKRSLLEMEAAAMPGHADAGLFSELAVR